MPWYLILASGPYIALGDGVLRSENKILERLPVSKILQNICHSHHENAKPNNINKDDFAIKQTYHDNGKSSSKDGPNDKDMKSCHSISLNRLICDFLILEISLNR